MLSRTIRLTPRARLAAVLPACILAATAGQDIDLTQLPLEALMNIEVTSISKKEQKAFRAPAAIYVLTAEDIRRSGMTTIPELLRMVPGIEVARIGTGKWAVTARGFNGRYSKKLLVMVDGRSVYSPLFAGVVWEMQDRLLEDIERIEIIRGPGATMWGANAVNGVINIITKKVRDTQGGFVTAGAGNEERGFGALRYGGKAGDHAFWRVHTKYFAREASAAPRTQQPLHADRWDAVQGGYHLDWNVSRRDSLSVQGDFHTGHQDQTIRRVGVAPPFVQPVYEESPFSRTNLSARWNRAVSESSGLSLQVYYHSADRDGGILRATADTLNLDMEHQATVGTRHSIVWGTQLRRVQSGAENTFQASLQPARFTEMLYAGFLQDDITLVPDELVLTVGSRVDHTTFTGVEVQPGAQLAWTPDPRQTVWFSLNRAVRTPSRTERHLIANLPPALALSGPVVIPRVFGNPQFGSESMIAREIGYGRQFGQRFSVDASAYYNTYTHLATLEPRPVFLERNPAPAHLVSPVWFENKMFGETYGAELAANWILSPRWRLTGGHTWFRAAMHRTRESLLNDTELAVEGNSPRHRSQLRSQWDLSKNWQFDSSAYYVGRLVSQNIPSYTRLDARLGWRPRSSLELDFVVQNILKRRHLEFISEERILPPTEIGRSAYAKITWHF